jgi:hypothetical protein
MDEASAATRAPAPASRRRARQGTLMNLTLGLDAQLV